MAKITQTTFKPKWYHLIIVKYWWTLTILVILAVFLIEYLFFIRVKIEQTVNGGPLDLATYQQILAEQEEYLKNLEQWYQETKQIDEGELDKLNYVVAEKMDFPTVLKQIDFLSVQSGWELISFGFDYKNGETLMNFTFKGGNYEGIKRYLDFMERNIRIMDIETINMKELGNVLSFSVKSYYLDGK